MHIINENVLLLFQVKPLGWSTVHMWASKGGSMMGTSRTTVKDLGAEKVAEHIKKHNIHALIVVGGFEVQNFTAILGFFTCSGLRQLALVKT